MIAKRGRGRPAGQSSTRESIVAEARRQFSERGYRATTLRSIAAGAGVDPRLLLHYFGSKQELFEGSVELPIQPERALEIVFADGREGVPRNAARLLVSVMQDPHSRGAMTAILRAAVTEPEAADLIRGLLTHRLLVPIARQLGGEKPELRASFMASSLVGVAVVRHIVGVEPLASASPEQLAAAIEPVFAHYLNGDWVLPSGE